MGYEFLADMAIRNESEIDQVTRSQGRFRLLNEAPLLSKARILSTGLHKGEIEDSIKNGRKARQNQGITGIGGYPQCLRQNNRTSLEQDWLNLFWPGSEELKHLPAGSVLFQFDLKLIQPFYSNDNTSLYPVENSVRKDNVFGTAYLGAGGVKGLLRWAWRICWGDSRIPDEIYIFGPRSGNLDENNARQGSLYTYPLFWNGQLGMDLINPHDKRTMTGTNPIKYEVVKQDATTSLFLLLINKNNNSHTLLEGLKPAITLLLEDSGLSAKRGTGWGQADIKKCSAWVGVPPGQGSTQSQSEDDIWADLVDEDDQLKDMNDTTVFTKDVKMRLTGISKTQIKKPKNKEKIKQRITELWQKRQESEQGAEEPDENDMDIAEMNKNNPEEICKAVLSCLKSENTSLNR